MCVLALRFVSAGQIYMYLTKRGKPDFPSLRFDDGLVSRLYQIKLLKCPSVGQQEDIAIFKEYLCLSAFIMQLIELLAHFD